MHGQLLDVNLPDYITNNLVELRNCVHVSRACTTKIMNII